MPECKICKHPRGLEVTSLVQMGKTTITEAARYFDVTYQDFWHHLKKHTEFPKPEPSDDIAMLRYILVRLQQRVDELCNMPVSSMTERSLATLVQQLRGCITDLAQLEGRLHAGPLVQLNQLNVQYNTLTELVVSSLCPICKQKVLRSLENAKEVA